MVTIICCTMRNSYRRNVFENYHRQSMTKKELIIILNRDDMDIQTWEEEATKYPNVTVYQLPEAYALGKCLNYGVTKAKYSIIAKFDDDDYYAADYLIESFKALRKTNAAIVGKKTSYIYFEDEQALMLFRKGEEEKYCVKLKGGTLLFRKSAWDKVKFSENRKYGSDAHFLMKCSKEGFKIYSVSKNNYVCIRRKERDSHTQKLSNKRYMSRCEIVSQTDDYSSIITKKYRSK